jgi:hypothetical protein
MAQEANGGAPKGDRKTSAKDRTFCWSRRITGRIRNPVFRHGSALTWARWAFDELKLKQRNRRAS